MNVFHIEFSRNRTGIGSLFLFSNNIDRVCADRKLGIETLRKELNSCNFCAEIFFQQRSALFQLLLIETSTKNYENIIGESPLKLHASLIYKMHYIKVCINFGFVSHKIILNIIFWREMPTNMLILFTAHGNEIIFIYARKERIDIHQLSAILLKN